jgi:hypothetical protein
MEKPPPIVDSEVTPEERELWPSQKALSLIVGSLPLANSVRYALSSTDGWLLGCQGPVCIR